MEEDRYESITLIVKTPAEGDSWFDRIFDLIASECQGGDHGDCTCGMESMGGSTGSLDQAYRHQGIADDIVQVDTEDLRIAVALVCGNLSDREQAVIDRLNHELNWWNELKDSIEEEEEEDGEEDPRS